MTTSSQLAFFGGVNELSGGTRCAATPPIRDADADVEPDGWDEVDDDKRLSEAERLEEDMALDVDFERDEGPVTFRLDPPALAFLLDDDGVPLPRLPNPPACRESPLAVAEDARPMTGDMLSDRFLDGSPPMPVPRSSSRPSSLLLLYPSLVRSTNPSSSALPSSPP